MNIETDVFFATIGPTGNLVRLFFKPAQCDVFHWSDEERELLSHPQYYGVPLIFPPNRTEKGQFRFQGRLYQLPINDPVHDFNVHGFLLNKRPESILQQDNSWIVRTVWDSHVPGFSGFPHAFEIIRKYCFDSTSVQFETSITNHSEMEMPYGIGFHTAFAAPENETVFIRVPHNGMFWHVNPSKRLPDGTMTPLISKEAAILNGEAEVKSFSLGALFSSPPEGARFEIFRRQTHILFTADPKFRFFAVWNAEGKREMICLEPMSWLTNAPNLPLPYERSGVCGLPAGECVCFSMKVEFSL